VDVISEHQLFTVTRQVAPGAKSAIIDCLVLFVADTDH